MVTILGKEYDKATTVLNLSFKSLKQIPEEVYMMEDLVELDVSYNNIQEIPRELFLLTKLVRLNVSHNKLNDISVYIREVLHLTHLDLCNNNIETVPLEWPTLEKLKCLYLYSNKLEFPLAQNENNLTAIKDHLFHMRVQYHMEC